MHLLESETAGEFECGVNEHAQNANGSAETDQNRAGQAPVAGAATAILPL